MSGAYQTSPLFYDNAGQFLSASSLNRIRDNVALVDEISYRPVGAFDSAAHNDTVTPGYYNASGDRIWDGYTPPHQTGMTDLIVEGVAQNIGSATIRITLDGQQQGTTFAPGANWTRMISVSGRAVGSSARLEVFLVGPVPQSSNPNNLPSTAKALVTDAYVTPVPLGNLGAFPGTATFDTVFNAAKWSLTARGAEWLFRRMALTPVVGQRLPLFQIGPSLQANNTNRPGIQPLWYGSILKTQSNDILRVYGLLSNWTATQIRLVATINGGANITDDIYGIGTFGLSLPSALSGISVGQRAVVGLFGEVLDQGATQRQTRWSFTTIGTDADSAGYAYGTLPAEFVPAVNINPGVIRDRGNTLAAIIAATKSRIDNASYLWNRVRCMRRHYDKTQNADGFLINRAPPTFTRRGSRLVVRGRDVQIAWGAISGPKTIPEGKHISQMQDEYSIAHTERIIEADKLDTVSVPLDSIEGLTRTTMYRLLGDVQWAGEYLI